MVLSDEIKDLIYRGFSIETMLLKGRKLLSEFDQSLYEHKVSLVNSLREVWNGTVWPQNSAMQVPRKMEIMVIRQPKFLRVTVTNLFHLCEPIKKCKNRTKIAWCQKIVP